MIDYPVLSIWKNTSVWSETDSKNKFSMEFVGYCYTYTSLLWTERYAEPGDFEIYAPATKELLQTLQPGYLITRSDNAEAIALLETVQLEQDLEDGDKITATGRMLSCLLDFRRCVWGASVHPLLANLYANEILYDLAAALVSTAQLDPFPSSTATTYKNCGRNFPGIVCGTVSISQGGEAYYAVAWNFNTVGTITGSSANGFTPEMGATYLECLENVAGVIGGGFRVKFQGLTAENPLLFWFYGDRPEAVDAPLEFSDKNGALTSMTLSHTNTNVINKTYLLFEDDTEYQDSDTGETYGWAASAYQKTQYTGYDRRETAVSASGCKETSEIGRAILSGAINNDYNENYSVSCTTDINASQYVYGTDYDVGSVVKLKSYKYGISQTARITAVTESFDENGRQLTPEFKILETEVE